MVGRSTVSKMNLGLRTLQKVFGRWVVHSKFSFLLWSKAWTSFSSFSSSLTCIHAQIFFWKNLHFPANLHDFGCLNLHSESIQTFLGQKSVYIYILLQIYNIQYFLCAGAGTEEVRKIPFSNSKS